MLLEKAKAIEPEIYAVYRHLHENPELSLQEVDTSAFLRTQLEKNGIREIYPVGKTGLMAVIHGISSAADPGFLLRADMDALPLQEDGEHVPCSCRAGVMHACGHDAHAAILLGTACLLKKCQDTFGGTVFCFFQPAEENFCGAKMLFEQSTLDLSAIKGTAACHMMPDLYAGDVGLQQGTILASADSFDLVVTGRSGHGAHPYTAVDPVAASALLIEALQQLVSREVSALDAAVISICSLHTNSDAWNIIPEQLAMKGTLRALKQSTRMYLQQRMRAVCAGVEQSQRVHCELVFHEGAPALVNDRYWVQRVEVALRAILGEKHIRQLDCVTMGAEDFAYIRAQYPGIFVRIGCRTPGQDFTPIHSSAFRVDRRALQTGMLTLTAIAKDFFAGGVACE